MIEDLFKKNFLRFTDALFSQTAAVCLERRLKRATVFKQLQIVCGYEFLRFFSGGGGAKGERAS